MPAPNRFTRSDRETLRGLLDSGKLTPAQAEALADKYAQLVSGKLVELSEGDRKSVDDLYDEHKLGGLHLTSARKQSEANKALLAKFAAMPRPRKPPGR